MLIKLPTYLFKYVLPTYILTYHLLHVSYLPTYLPSYLPSTYLPTYLFIYLSTYLLMKKIEVQMLLYKLTKKFMEVQRNMLNAFDIIIFYKAMGWFDGQNYVGSLIVLILHDVFLAYGFFLFPPFTNAYISHKL